MTASHAEAAAESTGWAVHLRLGDVPVRVELSFFLIAALLGSSLGTVQGVAIWVGVVLVSVLVHELGHAVAMRLSGVSSRIVLHGMGGLTIPAASIPSRPKRIAVDLAGPLSGLFLLGVPAVWLSRTLDDPSQVLDLVIFSVVWVNVAWSFVNLLPILPLDGGRIVASLLPPRLSDRYARLEPLGFPILLALMFTNVLGVVMYPMVAGSIQLIANAFQLPLLGTL